MSKFVIQPHFRLQEWVAEDNCACHWTVNVAASSGHGKLYAGTYSVAPAGIFVPPDSL